MFNINVPRVATPTREDRPDLGRIWFCAIILDFDAKLMLN